MARAATLITMALDACPELMELTWAAASKSQYQSLLIYADDVVPGNVMRPNNPRKFTAIYISLELWATQLHHEELWIPIALVRQSDVKRLRGGVSELWVRVVKECLLSVDSGLATAGLVVNMEGSAPQLLMVDHVSLLQDDGALKQILDVKGAAGLRCCHKCVNMTPVSASVAEDSDFFVDLRCTDTERLVPNTDQAMWEDVAELSTLRVALKKTHFEHEETLRGINFNPFGVLLCEELRALVKPVTSSLYDPLHVWWSSGLVHYELNLFLHCLRLHANKKKLPLRFKDIRSEYQEWHFPNQEQRCQTTVEQLFADSREESFRGNATDMIMALTFLEHYLLDIAPLGHLGGLEKEFASVRALVETCGIVMALKYGGDPDILLPRLESSIAKHMNVFCGAYGADKLKPKHHQQMHVLEQMRKRRLGAHGRRLPPTPYADCFSAERKNKKAKASADRMTDPKCFGLTALAILVNDQMRRLHELTFKDHLVGRIVASPEFGADVSSANAVVANGERFAEGDIVETDGCAFQVVSCARSRRAEHFLVVKPLDLVRRAVRTSVWRHGAAGVTTALPLHDDNTRRSVCISFELYIHSHIHGLALGLRASSEICASTCVSVDIDICRA